MANRFELLALELKAGFLILFGSVCGALFGTVGLVVGGLCFVLLIYVIATFQRKPASSIQVMEPIPQKQEKEDKEENEEMDDLLLLNPTDEEN